MKLIKIGVKIALALFIVFPVHAQELFTGSGVICDTREQVERYVAVYDGNADTAIELVNAEADSKSACGEAQVVYEAVKEVGHIRMEHDLGKIVELTVVGIGRNGIWDAVEPHSQFTVFMLPGQEI
jgi:hypothetical protein